MPESVTNQAYSVGQQTFQNSFAVRSDAILEYEIPLPGLAATQLNGELTARTSDSAGTVTLAAGHPVINGVVDLYWLESGEEKARRGMTATVTVNDVAVTGGTGDALPILNSTIKATTNVIKGDPLNIPGDQLQIIAVVYRNGVDRQGTSVVKFKDSGSTIIRETLLFEEGTIGGLAEAYVPQLGTTNPYAGNAITAAEASHSSATAGRVLVAAGHNYS